MILSDSSIEYLCLSGLIEPYHPEQLQPASYDLQLGKVRFINKVYDQYLLMPRQFVLASTEEEVRMPYNLVGRLEGKSSRARQGLIIHTAGFIDPGFYGQLTLEITNLSDKPIYLTKGMLIAQIAFTLLDKAAKRPYGSPGLGSHYQGQIGPTESRSE